MTIPNGIDVTLFDASSDVARRAKAGVKFFYVGKLQRPFIHAVHESAFATFSSPYKVHWTGDPLVLQLEQAWAVEATTGEVLGKRDFAR